jgi:uncharacterized protein (UPF0261 family)
VTRDVTGAVVAVVATLDTKGEEVDHLRRLLAERGVVPWIIDTGVLGETTMAADVSRARIAELGGGDLDDLREGDDPSSALKVMAAGARAALAELQSSDRLRATIGVTGGKGAALFADATADLPLTSLKILVASARAEVLARIAAASTTVIFPTLVDLMGLNPLTRQVLHRAAVLAGAPDDLAVPDRTTRTVAVTAFGVTTTAAMACVRGLRERGLETLVFPANGAGGRLLERLVDEGRVDGVLDLTTTEIADEVVGGTASAGSGRLCAAGRAGIPQWIAPGAVDMVNFGAPDTVPKEFAGRTFYRHSDFTTLLRTSAAENNAVGRVTAQRVSSGHGARQVCWTAGGFSDYDRPGRPFHDPAADRAWLEGLQSALGDDVDLVQVDEHINDPAVAHRAVDWMVAQLAATASTREAQ